MSDPKDPFSAQPYIPPSQRGPDTTEDAPETERPAAEEVAPQTPVEPASPDTDVQSDVEPTVPVEDVESHDWPPPAAQDAGSTHEMPAATDRVPDDRESTVVLPTGSHDDGTMPPATGRRRVAGLTAGLLVLAAVAGAGGAAAYDAIRGDDSVLSSLDTGSDTGSAPAGQIEKVAQKVRPSVVQINVTAAGSGGAGTGIIISDDGQILTNNHVVESAADDGTITAVFNDGSFAKAEVVGRDPATDLAVIKAEGVKGLAPATLGSSADLEVGQEVVAVGSPLGLESTVTSGIVSAVNRPVPASQGGDGDEAVFPAIQTDASINLGNSGGPLVDLEGRVVGVVAALKPSGGFADTGSIGLGFAIPIDLAKSVSRHLVKGETVQHARIGVTVGPAVAEDRITQIGAEIKEVTKKGAGDEAGLQKDDVVTKVNSTPIASSTALVAAIRGYEPGENVTLTYVRDGETKTTQVTLDSDGGKLGS